VQVDSVVLSPSAVNLTVNLSEPLKATVRDAQGIVLTGPSVDWSSSNPAVATVTSAGLVVGVGPGSATITGTSGGKTGTAEVTVAPPFVVSSFSMGPYHACGLAADGQAFCWGSNFYGQLGDGTTTDRSVPVSVNGSLKFTSLAVGDLYTCGLVVGGAAYCWGDGSRGQLGNGSTSGQLLPVAVTGGLTFSSLATRGFSVCGLTPAGKAYCWGNNFDNLLGTGSPATENPSPAPVLGGLAFAEISIGASHTCGVTPAGAAYCWGTHYQLIGDGSSTTLNQPTPVAVAGGLTFTSIAAGVNHTCGVTRSGVMNCWGFNLIGQLGDLTRIDHYTPAPVAGGVTFKSVAASLDYSCGVSTLDRAYCWGTNSSGQLGDSTLTDRMSPTPIKFNRAVTSIQASYLTTCARASTGAVFCWGDNSVGQLGDGTTRGRATPAAVRDPSSSPDD